MQRSIAKSVVWRAIGVALLGGISFAVTGSWTESLYVTVTFNVIRIVLYVVHERIWERIGWGRLPEPARAAR